MFDRMQIKKIKHHIFLLTICDFLGIGAGGWIGAKVFAVEPVCVPGMSHTEDDSPAKVNKPGKY